MPFALELAFDDRAEQQVLAIWSDLDAHGIQSLFSFTQGRHRPHVSLAVLDEIDHAGAVRRLKALARGAAPQLQLSSLGLFPAKAASIAFLGVAPTQELLGLQQGAWSLIDKSWRPWDLYQPSHWVPHCTLSMNVPPALLQSLVGVITPALPILATVKELAIVDVTTGHSVPVPGWPR